MDRVRTSSITARAGGLLMCAAAVVAVMLLVPPGPADAVHGCHVKDTRVIARSRRAIVLMKRKFTYYGDRYASARSWVLRT